MNIGIFGDSYAAKITGPDAWWKQLHHDYGHDTVSFGADGSSIMYSAQLIGQHSKDFDFNIWCLTCPGRFSIKISDKDTNEDFWHSTSVMSAQGDVYDTTDRVSQHIVEACRNYLKYIFDIEHENLIGKALVQYFLHKVPNLLILPCFYPPLDQSFNLFKLCTLELQTSFPDKAVHEIYRNYHDIRSCHLTALNNKILARLINQNLRPGIFSANYEDFCFDGLLLTDMLQPKNNL